MMRSRLAFLGFVLALVASASAQDINIQVELAAPLGTDVSRKGDAISARVISPSALQGDSVEGKVNESRSGNKFTGTAVLSFSFDMLRHGGQTVPISAKVESITNSKGQQDVDEEGRVIRRNNSNLVKAAVGTGFGSLLGGLAGGGRGAAIGAVAGAAASVILIEVAADGPGVRFDAGSVVLLSARERSGPSLASLAPNNPPAMQSASAQARPSYEPAAGPNPTPAAGATSATPGQPDLTAIKADFIPGEKILLYDDFSDMVGDEPPPHWKVRGTVAELKVGGGIRQLTLKGESVTLTPNVKDLPRNFTIETDLTIEGTAPDCRPEMEWYFRQKDGQNTMYLRTKQEPSGWWMRLDADDELGEKTVPVDFKQPVKLAMWVQNGRVRLYLNGARIFDVNQVTLQPIASIDEHMWTGEKSIGYRFVRIGESTPDFSQTIASSGRYVTHDILFDTDSDHLKPESAPVIKSIALGLATNPAMKLQVEGHTDSTGGASHNLDLSTRRAEAVKAILVSQFNVDVSRLTTAGMGDTKPIDSNDTPQGRAQNRRVEFVRK